MLLRDRYKRRAQASVQAFSLPEVLVATLVAGLIVLGVFRIAGGFKRQAKSIHQSLTAEQHLDRFQHLLLRDLDRAGSDASGRMQLSAFQYKPQGQTCVADNFEFGFVKYPTGEDCTTVLGLLGILSHQGVDLDRNGQFFPEEGVDFSGPTPRSPLGSGQGGANLTSNTLHDLIVYDFDRVNDTVIRKNVGRIVSSQDDFSEVVLRDVVDFNVVFKEDTFLQDPSSVEGTLYFGVIVQVVVHQGSPDPSYENPELPSDSKFYRYRTLRRSITFDVIREALAVI